ncbi:hypothetical protein JOF34_000950 [Microbacterium amylolyticum]|uniref:Uncharacterized protein n=1 Tax=Microbacterium amylolyticum TaxID=936337 RepID=A0ABS4ZGF3_9MICO|nr:hypothetical protein [Microbacterium amylolyticum]
MLPGEIVTRGEGVAVAKAHRDHGGSVARPNRLCHTGETRVVYLSRRDRDHPVPIWRDRTNVLVFAQVTGCS